MFADYRTRLSLLVCVLLSGCGDRKTTEERMWFPMGTFATVTVPSESSSRLDDYTTIVKNVFSDIDNGLSIYKEESELSQVNRSAGMSFVSVSEHTRRIIELSLYYAEATDGCFDPTVAPLVRLWGFSGGRRREGLPVADEIRMGLDRTGYAHMIVSNDMVRLDRPGMMMDMGGIAKGYAVDISYRDLLAKNAKDLMINLGGNIRCMGTAGAGRPWRIGVRDPFDETKLLGYVDLDPGMAVATSGNYERFVIINGERYAHIIDPRTGYPVKGMAGVTVISATAVEADAISTSLFVAGENKAGGIMSSFPDSHALLVPDRRPVRVIVDSWMKKRFVSISGTAVEDMSGLGK